MTNENRILMERAIGIIEGVCYCVVPTVHQALSVALEMLDEVVKDEESIGG